MTIQAIETAYRGYRFRSRLEARWAVFFDQMGIRWDYEPQGFETPAGPYLPDFLLHEVNGERGVWFEVKPDGPDVRDERWDHLVIGTQRELIIAFGISGPEVCSPRYDGDLESILLAQDEDGNSGAYRDGDREFCICPICGRIGVQYQGAQGRICSHPGVEVDEYGPYPGHPRVLASYVAARSARFEHGESGPGVVQSSTRGRGSDYIPKGPPPARLGDLLPRVAADLAARTIAASKREQPGGVA